MGKRRHYRRRWLSDQCVYCGGNTQLTADHLPPQCTLPKVAQRDLVCVPACRTCNGNASKDDEYLCLILTLSREAGEHPVALRARESVLSALSNARKAGFRKAFSGSLRFVDQWTRSGILLGTEVGYKVDYVRVNRVMERIIRGLFFHETRTILPQDISVKIVHFHPPAIRSEETVHRVAAITQQVLNDGQSRFIGDSAFLYAFYTFDPAHPHHMAWVLAFYERLVFLAVTKDSRGAAPHGQHANQI